jgi:hypothetical protein
MCPVSCSRLPAVAGLPLPADKTDFPEKPEESAEVSACQGMITCFCRYFNELRVRTDSPSTLSCALSKPHRPFSAAMIRRHWVHLQIQDRGRYSRYLRACFQHNEWSSSFVTLYKGEVPFSQCFSLSLLSTLRLGRRTHLKVYICSYIFLSRRISINPLYRCYFPIFSSSP